MKIRTDKAHFKGHCDIDECYFDKIDNADKSYFLGLALADWNVSKPSCSYIFTLAHVIRDRELVDMFVSKSKSTYAVGTNDGKTHTVISNQYMCRRLIELGIVERKTGKEDFNIIQHIPAEFVPDFIRGYFDGDGWVSGYRSDFSVGMCCASKKFLEDMSLFLYEHAGINLKEVEPHSSIWMIRYGTYNAVKLYEYMYYYDVELYLKRKYKYFRNWVENEYPTYKHLKAFTPEEDQYILDNIVKYPCGNVCGYTAVARSLERSYSGVRARYNDYLKYLK